jgi:hypothetical protein
MQLEPGTTSQACNASYFVPQNDFGGLSISLLDMQHAQRLVCVLHGQVQAGDLLVGGRGLLEYRRVDAARS